MSTSTTIRVNTSTRKRLSNLAKQSGRPVGEVVATLIDHEEARRLFEQHNAAIARAANDPAELMDLNQEQAELESTLLDGLEADPWPLNQHGQPQR